MGLAGSNIPRERHKSSSEIPGSPTPKDEAFVFEKKPDSRLILAGGASGNGSHDDEEPYYTKPIATHDPDFPPEPRQRAYTLDDDCSNTEVSDKPPALPTVFKWDGGGKQVFISGTFSDWRSLPMVRSHGDFVTIIDLPEGDHQYKFCVDGQWRHDPKLVSFC